MDDQGLRSHMCECDLLIVCPIEEAIAALAAADALAAAVEEATETIDDLARSVQQSDPLD